MFFPMDFGGLANDGLIDGSALRISIAEATSRKYWLLAPQTIFNEERPRTIKKR